MTTKFNITQIFKSIQGEGRLAGVVSVFIRLAGCNLRCRWCDTAYSWPTDAGDEMAIDKIIEKVKSFGCTHIVVTGGEPLIHDNLEILLAALRNEGFHITLETAATGYMPLSVDLMSISPKLSNSTPDGPQGQNHEKSRLNLDALANFIDNYDYQLKFVVANETDIAETQRIIDQLGPLQCDKVMLMPQATDRMAYRTLAPMVANWCIEKGFTFCPRLHVEFWDKDINK
ncbi:MAG: 7-carboxy-7-deazaguanine synthase QueE [Phycisphaerae bacterium]|nr:7-carboxy-7-deazaguanine synthase QueE [Phycisphaerae bacterium]